MQTENKEFFLKISPNIFPWIAGRNVTTIRPVKTRYGGQDLRFYRNIYLKEEKLKVPLSYDHLAFLQQEIQRGAFAWVVDSHYESESGDQIGPYEAVIDLDGKDLEHWDVVARVFEFMVFCQEQVGLEPILIHSGNRSL